MVMMNVFAHCLGESYKVKTLQKKKSDGDKSDVAESTTATPEANSPDKPTETKLQKSKK